MKRILRKNSISEGDLGVQTKTGSEHILEFRVLSPDQNNSSRLIQGVRIGFNDSFLQLMKRKKESQILLARKIAFNSYTIQKLN